MDETDRVKKQNERFECELAFLKICNYIDIKFSKYCNYMYSWNFQKFKSALSNCLILVYAYTIVITL